MEFRVETTFPRKSTFLEVHTIIIFFAFQQAIWAILASTRNFCDQLGNDVKFLNNRGMPILSKSTLPNDHPALKIICLDTFPLSPKFHEVPQKRNNYLWYDMNYLP